MTASHKPVGCPTVSPYLVMTSASATIGFLTNVIGAQELRRFPGEGGKVAHAGATWWIATRMD